MTINIEGTLLSGDVSVSYLLDFSNGNNNGALYNLILVNKGCWNMICQGNSFKSLFDC